MKKEIVHKCLNGVRTSLLVWDYPFNSKGGDIIVCVSGNPGVVDFYTEFGEELHKRCSLPVCIIGQAGHEEMSGQEINSIENHEYLFNLEGQIAHKLDLITNCIDKKSKLHLIGHSIGAWQIIELTNKNPALIQRISSINLLFPTIQNMADSPNGKFLNNVLRRIHMIVLLLLQLIRMLPKCINIFLIRSYILWHTFPSHYFHRIYKVLNPNVMEKVLFLAFDEMDTVIKLNRDGIEKIKHLTNVIYSDSDQWAPLTYIEDLKVYAPHLSLEEVRASHAFVLKSSEIIAEKVSNFIRAKLPQINIGETF